MGRSKTYTEERVKEILVELDIYIANTDIPIVAEFAYQNEIPRQTLYELDDLRDTIKRLIDKKEANLERMALNNKINHTMAIFSLKQLGWRDKQEIEHSGEIKKINVTEVLNEIDKNLNDD
jgi:hypothetical protein